MTNQKRKAMYMLNKYRETILLSTFILIGFIYLLIIALFLMNNSMTLPFLALVINVACCYITFSLLYSVYKEVEQYDFDESHTDIKGKPEHSFRKFFKTIPLPMIVFIFITSPFLALVMLKDTKN